MSGATFWLQRSDLSVVADKEPAPDVAAVLAGLGQLDWAAERAREAALGDGGCPAGLGVVRGDGAIFHIIPKEGGFDGWLHSLDVPRPDDEVGLLKRLWRQLSTMDTLAFRDADEARLRRALADFLAGRDAAVVAALRAVPGE